MESGRQAAAIYLFVTDLKFDCGFGTSMILISSFADETTTFSIRDDFSIEYAPGPGVASFVFFDYLSSFELKGTNERGRL